MPGLPVDRFPPGAYTPRMLKTLAGFFLVLCLVIASPGSRFAAQSAAPFTAEDMQRVATINVLDLSEDGRLVAAAIRRPIDNPETDHGRFGDPTYLNPSRGSVVIFDTRSGRSWTPFRDLVEARRRLVARRPAARDPDGIGCAC
jgi:hypothetical protein